jgi:hypothetical protein
MGARVVTSTGYEMHEDGNVIRLVKDGVCIIIPGPGELLQEVLDGIVLCADSIAKQRARSSRFKVGEEAKPLRECASRRGGEPSG